MVGLAIARWRHARIELAGTGLELAGLDALAPTLALRVAFVAPRPEMLAGFHLHRRIQQFLQQLFHSVAALEQLLRQLFYRVTVWLGHCFVSFVMLVLHPIHRGNKR